MAGLAVSFDVVTVQKPEDANVIIGQAHFIKTVEDLHEALAGVSPHLRFGLAFCEASGDRLVRRSGNDDELTGLATANARAIAAGHAFVILLRNGFPVNVLNPVKAVPEVCSIFCGRGHRSRPRGGGRDRRLAAAGSRDRRRRGQPPPPAAGHRLQAVTPAPRRAVNTRTARKSGTFAPVCGEPWGVT
jgi:adenosine/AMP kinase